jgi:hypothetical protein
LDERTRIDSDHKVSWPSVNRHLAVGLERDRHHALGAKVLVCKPADPEAKGGIERLHSIRVLSGRVAELRPVYLRLRKWPPARSSDTALSGAAQNDLEV